MLFGTHIGLAAKRGERALGLLLQRSTPRGRLDHFILHVVQGRCRGDAALGKSTLPLDPALEKMYAVRSVAQLDLHLRIFGLHRANFVGHRTHMRLRASQGDLMRPRIQGKQQLPRLDRLLIADMDRRDPPIQGRTHCDQVRFDVRIVTGDVAARLRIPIQHDPANGKGNEHDQAEPDQHPHSFPPIRTMCCRHLARASSSGKMPTACAIFSHEYDLQRWRVLIQRRDSIDQPTRAIDAPSTGNSMPEIKRASSEARNNAAFATSQASPMRLLSGTLALRSASISARL